MGQDTDSQNNMGRQPQQQNQNPNQSQPNQQNQQGGGQQGGQQGGQGGMGGGQDGQRIDTDGDGRTRDPNDTRPTDNGGKGDPVQR